MRITFCKIEKQHHQDSTQHTPDHAAPNVAIINREYLIGVTPPPVALTFQHNNPFIHIAPGLILPGLRPQHLACTPCGHAPQGRGLRTSASHRRIPRENRHHRICKSITSVALRPGALFPLHTAHSTRKTFATVLQTPEIFSWHLQQCCKRQNFFRGTCNGVANAGNFFVALATVLQTPKFFSWHLQRCCKRFHPREAAESPHILLSVNSNYSSI